MTQIQARGGAQPTNAPVIEAIADQCVYYTLGAASARVGLRIGTLKVLLHRHMDQFDCALYQQVRSNWWPRRLLTPRDMETIERLRPVILVRR